MDYGGNDRRRTKGDLKKKRLNRGYKRGGQFRTHNVDETGDEVKQDKMGKVIEAKKTRKKNRKY